MIKILILEDDETLIGFYKMCFEDYAGHIELVFASSMQATRALCQKNAQQWPFDVMVFDGIVDDGFSGPLVEEIKASGFPGVMIANSGTNQSELVLAGCKIATNSKNVLPKLIMHILGEYSFNI